MCRSLWQTPAAFTLISTCVPPGCGVGWSTSFRGALKSVTWKLFITVLPEFLFLGIVHLGLAVHLGAHSRSMEQAACQRCCRDDSAGNDHLSLDTPNR